METKCPCLSRAGPSSSQQHSHSGKSLLGDNKHTHTHTPLRLPPFPAENRDGSYLPGKAGIQLLLETKHPWGLEGGTEAPALCSDEPDRSMGKRPR